MDGQVFKKIKWNLTPEQLQEKFASFIGNEYLEYLNSKKKLIPKYHDLVGSDSVSQPIFFYFDTTTKRREHPLTISVNQ